MCAIDMPRGVLGPMCAMDMPRGVLGRLVRLCCQSSAVHGYAHRHAHRRECRRVRRHVYMQCGIMDPHPAIRPDSVRCIDMYTDVYIGVFVEFMDMRIDIPRLSASESEFQSARHVRVERQKINGLLINGLFGIR